MLVNLTVTLGQLLNLTVTIGGFVALYVSIERRITAIETKIDPLWRMYERRNQPAGTTGSSK